MLRLTNLFLALFFFSVAASAQSPAPSGSRVKSIADKKTIRIAYRADATPFSFQKEKNEPTGYSIDLCKLISKSIESQFKLPYLKIEWIPVTVQTRFSTVSSGKADMECGSSTMTLSRMKEVDFSSIIFVQSTGIIVSRASNIRSFADLGGRKIAVVSGTTNEQAITEQIHRQKLIAFTSSLKDRDEGIAALQAGQADAFASDKLLLVGAQMKYPGEFVILPDDLSVEPYAIALPRGDWAMRLAVNTGLAEIFRGEQIGDVYKRWFEQIGLQPSDLVKAAYAFGGLAN
jgi:glutamate/aspartate transport system substrate-binding protein